MEGPKPTGQGETASWGELWRSGLVGRLALLTFGVWLNAGDELMVAAITPQIIGDIGGAGYLAWLTALFEVGSISAGAASALLVFRLGLRRGLFLAAMIYFAGCLLSGLAPNMPVMLAGRFVQGVGGGAMLGMSLIAAWKLFPERLIARVIATISMVWGVAVFSGPLFGAFVATYAGWRGAFFAFALQALVLAVIIHIRMPDETGMDKDGAHAFPAGRIALLGAGVIAFAASGIAEKLAYAFVLLAAGLMLVGSFLFLDGRAQINRLFPAGSKNPFSPAGTTLLMVFGLSAGTIAFIIYAPTFLSARLGLSALEIGSIVMLESIAWSIAALLVSGTTRKHEATVLMLGFFWVVLSIAGLAYAVPYGSIPLIILCAVGQGAGFGMAWTFVFRRAVELVDPADKERITSAISTTQRTAYAIGAAYVGFIANRSGFASSDLAEEGTKIAQSLYLWSLFPAFIGLAAMVRFVGLVRRIPAAQSRKT